MAAVLVVVGSLSGALVVCSPFSPVLAAAGPSLPSLKISGLGFGHGRGMGQWGAYGYASMYNWSYQQILGHYYGGTTLGTLPSPEPDITVHITELDGHNTIATSADGAELVAAWGGSTPVAAPAFEVTSSGGTQSVFSGQSCAGPWQPVASTSAFVTIAGAVPGTSPPQAAGIASSELQACLPGLGSRIYQGDLVAQTNGQTQNVLPLEDYVDGVVPAESPPTWANTGGEAALEAQAVAARSYALAFAQSSGVICDTTACQMYTGLPDQYGLTADNAVSATAGQVLYCNAGSNCGPGGSVALAEYSASTGGYTAGGAFPAVMDLGDSVPANPVHSWTVYVPVSDIESTFGSVGTLEQVDVTQRNGLGQFGGRAQDVEVVGESGSVSLSGDQFAADFGLPSDWFAIGGTSSTVPTTSTTTTVPSTTTTTAPPASATTTTSPGPSEAAPPGPPLGPDNGYWVVGAEGDVAAFGAAKSYGTAAGTSLQGIVRGMVATPDYKGYWMVGSNGGVLAFGDANWYGSASKLHLAKRVVGIAATPDGRGYWLVASDGGIFAFGDAGFHGSTGQLHLKKPIVGIAATPDGRGYWLVASDGGVFAFGDARFYGSVGQRRLNEPVTGIVPSADGQGYFIVARDGGVFAFGDARFLGSLPSEGINARVAAVAPTYDNGGYYVLTTSGRVYTFGDATPAAQLEAVGSESLPGRAVAIVCHRSLYQAARVRAARSAASRRHRP
ncbi:MAG: SpoIID/LytB domain-containing protein [Acidimicrobiales bacterium]